MAPLALLAFAAGLVGCATSQEKSAAGRLPGASSDAAGLASIVRVPPSPWPRIAPPIARVDPAPSDGDPARPTEPQPAQFDPSARYPFHLFPRSKEAATIVLTSATFGTIQLDHGCFRRSDSSGKAGALVLFDRTAQIGTDSEGYLAIFEGGSVSARIGEPAVWGGYPPADERDPDVRRLRLACGDGPIVAVGIPGSARLFALPYPEWVANYARAKKIGYQAAWDRVIACMKRREADGFGGLAARDGCIDQFN